MISIKGKITKTSVDELECPPEGEARLWDTKLTGFFVRARPSGKKVYAVRYKLRTTSKTFTIGTHGSPWTPDTARKKADDVLTAAKNGQDPTAEKIAERHALTVKGLIDSYLKDGPATKPKKRLSTWGADESNLRRHIEPLIGKETADSLTKMKASQAIQDIVTGKTAGNFKTDKLRGVARVAGGEGTARRTLITANAMFAWGIEHKLIKANPFNGIKMAKPPKKERFLSQVEAARFIDALGALETEGKVIKAHGDAIRLLLLTGARKTEIASLTWDEVNFERKRLILPPERTKAGGETGERQIVLGPPALDILNRRYQAGLAEINGLGEATTSPYVFQSNRNKGPVVGLRRAFVRVCERAGLAAIRLHDLRHSFASFAIASGSSLFLVSRLLGHASARSTERYAHIASDPMEEAVATLGLKFQNLSRFQTS